MGKEECIKLLKKYMNILKDEYGITSLSLFGSTARGSQKSTSDIDLFVDTNKQRETIRNRFDAIAADMEGASIAHTCYVNKIPFTLIRSISDAEGSAMDYNTFAGKAAEQSISIVLDVIAKIKP